MDTGVGHRSRRAFFTERRGRSGRTKLIENRDRDRFQQNAVVAMFRKIVECNIGQPGTRSAFLRKLPQAIALPDKRRSWCGLAAGVRPGAHIGDAQRCFAYQRRASGRKANPCHSRALGPKQLSVSLAPPASWQSRHVYFQISNSAGSFIAAQLGLRPINRYIPRCQQATPVSPAQA